jgi:hypothetical protein
MPDEEMKRIACVSLLMTALSCEPGGASHAQTPSRSSSGSAATSQQTPPSMASSDSAAPATAAAAAAATATAKTAPFIRERPQTFELKSVDACAYLGGFGFACIDALVAEPDPIRARYMRRLSDAYARLSRDEDTGSPAHAEIVECCNSSGPCGADKKTGHGDCPHMDDGYACLTAAEVQLTGKRNPKLFHDRACHCDWKRAQIPVMGGELACDGPDKPVNRSKTVTMSSTEAREVVACGTCDAQTGPSACANEVTRLRSVDPDVARHIERVHVTRCQVK